MPQNFIKFYGNDWRAKTSLRQCSLAARGAWIDMITLMMEAEPFGYLLVNGVAPSPTLLAQLTVTRPSDMRKALAELAEHHVFSVTKEGVIYSRRMVRDAARAAELSERGKRGGNPALVKPKVKPEDNPPDKDEVKLARAFQKPEARSQKPEARKKERVDSEPDGSAAAETWAFRGDVIKLKRADFDKLRRQFKHLNGAFENEVAKADAYYRDHPTKDGKTWFVLNKWLAKADLEAAEAHAEQDDSI